MLQISPPAVDASPWSFLTLLMLLVLIAGTTMGILFSIFAGKQHARLVEKEKVEELKKVQVEDFSGKDVYECPDSHCKWLTPFPSMKHDYAKNLVYPICPKCKKSYGSHGFDFALVSLGAGYVRSYVMAIQGKITPSNFNAAKKQFAEDVGRLLEMFKKKSEREIEKPSPVENIPIPPRIKGVELQVEAKTSPAA